MSLTKQQKEDVLKDVEGKLAKQKSLVFTDFTGLNVARTQTLRRQLREKSIEYQAVKKTLLGIALKKVGLEVDLSKFGGSVAVAVSYDDEIAPSKIIYDFAKVKENNAMKILGGVFQNHFITTEEVNKLAMIPSREVLLTQLVSVMIGPARGFAIALDAIRKQKEAQVNN